MKTLNVLLRQLVKNVIVSSQLKKQINGINTDKQTVHWRNNQPPMAVLKSNTNHVQKDTVIVPYGGYTVIRFVADNPGWCTWLLHCHIKMHQLKGMAVVIKETNRIDDLRTMYVAM